MVTSARPTVPLRGWRGHADSVALAVLDEGAAGVLDGTGAGWHDAAAADPARAHLLLDDGGPAGPAGYAVLAAPRGPEPGVELHRLVVAAERRRTGAGRALLHAALAVAGVPGTGDAAPDDAADGAGYGADDGVPADLAPPWAGTGRLWLEVAAGNTAARALYRSAGLVTESVLRAVPGDPRSAPLRLLLARG
ncbi:GNAT family N-acetyltransferase [Pseudonocardia spirodelae]|uniref:GNAT family N-acetyltransferase n=1 Tax=Pseudonocardia spirodelae TaxID=3133431 RepID=A0ABU8T1W0_9PSEU